MYLMQYIRELFDKTNNLNHHVNMNRRKFITGCICCGSLAAIASSAAYFKLHKTQDKPVFEGEDLVLGHIEIHLTEHCNLNCRYCSHFSCIADEEYYDIKKYEQDMAQMAEVTDSRIENIQLIGGEPLLHPKINEIFDITRRYFPLTNIDLITNSLLLTSKDDAFWEAMRRNNIYLLPSIYPVKIKWKTILDTASKHGVKTINDFNRKALTMDTLDGFRVKKFYKLNLDLKGRQKWKQQECGFGPGCTNYINGKLYPCFVISNIRHFNKKFKKKLIVTDKDYIDIYKISSTEEIFDFLYKEDMFPFCRYCFHSRPKFKWENSPEHDINEWAGA